MAKSGAVRDIAEGNALLHKHKAVAVGDAGYQGNEERSDAKAGGVQHPFRVIKRQFGFTSVFYGDLKKSTADRIALFTLSSFWMTRSKLIRLGA